MTQGIRVPGPMRVILGAFLCIPCLNVDAALALASRRLAAPSSEPFRPTAEPSLEGSRVEYLILTGSNLVGEFQRLADWKTATGVPAVVRSLDDVQADAVPGSDLQETIRNYIRAAYLDWGVQFVLLGGDTDIIPPRYVKLQFSNFNDPLSDLYYSCLDGNWNQDGDGYFGEAFVSVDDPGDDVDLFAEVYLGRAPVSTVTEARIFVDKTLAYENPAMLDFQDRMLLLAEVLSPPIYDPNGPPPITDGAIFADEIGALADTKGMNVAKYYEAQPLWPDTKALTRVAARSAIDSGYGIVVHVGHGYRYTLSAGDASMTVGDAAGFANGARAGLMYMLNCTAAAFDFESFAEVMLLNPDGGATCVLGAAREAFPVTSRNYQRAFFEQILELGERRVGVAMTKSRELFAPQAFLATVDRWTQFGYTLLGDPDLAVWTRARADLQVTGVPATIELGHQTLQLSVQDASGPVAGARIALLKANDAYTVAVTDAVGQATLGFEASTEGTLQLTVTAADQVPLQLQRTASRGSVSLVVASLGLADDGGGSGFGNSDGRFDAGETVRLSLPLHNAGTASASNISATLTSTDPDLEILQASTTYPDLGPLAETGAATPFVVRARAGVADGRLAQATLSLVHASGSETRQVSILLHAPKLRIRGLQLDDSRAGNGNGVQEAGEEVDLSYEIENSGSGTATAVQLVLDNAMADLELLDASAEVADLLPGMHATSSTFTVSETDVVASRTARLHLQSAQMSSNQIRTIELRVPGVPTSVGVVAVDDPDDVHLDWVPVQAADLLGYNVYRATSGSGPFVLANADPVQHAYFRDQDLQPSTRFYYRVAAVDSAGLESPWSEMVAGSTNPRQLQGFPLAVGDFSSSSPAVADVDGDGALDVLAVAENLYAWNAAGVELRDADNNALTWGVFFGSGEVFGSLAVGDLDANPGKEMVAVSWDIDRRYVVAVTGSGELLPGWPRDLLPGADNTAGSSVPPVIANLDESGPPEILVAARDGRVYAWHADGTEVADGDNNPNTDGVFLDTGAAFLRSALGVADLDVTRPGLEVVCGSTNSKLYVVDATGAPLPGWPRTQNADGVTFGLLFATGISIADMDRDGVLEMLFIDSDWRLHAMHLDGTELPGYPVSGIKASSVAVAPSPAIGNLVGDADLEVVVASIDGNVKAFDANGVPVLATIVTGRRTESSPLLGDLDGDGEIEILLGNEEGVLWAWNLDGSLVDGFPIFSRAEVRATPALADLDADGSAELVVQAWDGRLSVFALGVPWESSRFPWPTHRGNIHRTGEFGYRVPTPVLVSSLRASWTAEGAHLGWYGAADAAHGDVVWRVYRQGPFEANPLAFASEPAYNLELLAELRGRGELGLVDTDALPDRWYLYSVAYVDGDGTHEVVGGRVALETRSAPHVLRLLANVPNPFNPSTRLQFEVPSQAARQDILLALFDARGRLVRRLVAGRMTPGLHAVEWDGCDEHGAAVGSGLYVARLQAGGVLVSHKLTLLR